MDTRGGDYSRGGDYLRGGDLLGNDIFKHILSIGYEFETDQLIKLSLHENGHFLINSDVTLHILKQKVEMNIGEPSNDSDYILYVALDDVEQPYSKTLHIVDPPSIEESDFMAHLEDELERDAEYNTDYVEHMNESRPEDDPSNTKFQMTNDVGETDFSEVLEPLCDKRKRIHKNDLYRIRTAEEVYDIKFTENMVSDKGCFVLSNLEFVATYLKPRQRNRNVIMETFTDACTRISDHFDRLTYRDADFLIRNNGGTWSKVQSAKLYHKPDTNMYYLHVSDEPIRNCTFIPQMTFRFPACRGIEILKKMSEFTNATYNRPELKKKLEQFGDHFASPLENVERLTNELFAEYRRKRRLNMRKISVRSLHFYVFMIYYKLTAYICEYSKDANQEHGEYLKDYIPYMSRHSNYVFYSRCKEILREEVGKDADILELLYQRDVLARHFCDTKCLAQAKQPLAEAKPPLAQVKKQSRYYGDPAKSILSYFQHMERPLRYRKMSDTDVEEHRDWLKRSHIDNFSSQFPLFDDTVIVEDRGFYHQILMTGKQFVNKHLKTLSVTNLSRLTTYARTHKWAVDIKGKVLNGNRWRKTRKTKKSIEK